MKYSVTVAVPAAVIKVKQNKKVLHKEEISLHEIIKERYKE